MSPTIAVVGAGSWGTALAGLLARKGYAVRLWAFETMVVDSVNQYRQNTLYLPGIQLAATLSATNDVAAAVSGADCVLSVSPAQYVRDVMTEAAPAIAPGTLVINASKGIEKGSLNTMAEVLRDVLPEDTAAAAAFLSGPSFALEVARELATAVTIASIDHDAAVRAQQLFQTPYFRVYTSTDVVGVELGGALKNVIAIAAGMAVGLGLGNNATAALITRGLAEITRLGMVRGAQARTFAGLAGMGDLILTCTGELSRNRHVGVELGLGRRLGAILSEMTMVAEGIDTARAALALARREGIEMPIVEQVHAVLFEGANARDALETLMLREPKPEFEA
jgi:glycerol-3-phosphate dehydrogenase (NAD(P)+)